MIVLSIFVGLLLSNCLGYRSGQRDGYMDGRTDADNWWIGVEEETAKQRRLNWMREINHKDAA